MSRVSLTVENKQNGLRMKRGSKPGNYGALTVWRLPYLHSTSYSSTGELGPFYLQTELEPDHFPLTTPLPSRAELSSPTCIVATVDQLGSRLPICINTPTRNFTDKMMIPLHMYYNQYLLMTQCFIRKNTTDIPGHNRAMFIECLVMLPWHWDGESP